MKRKIDEVKNISETLFGYMEEAYNEGFETGAKSQQDCSWEKGVRDAWEYLQWAFGYTENNTSSYFQTVYEFRNMLRDFDPVMYTKDYVEDRNKKDHAKTEPIKVGDIVIAPSGKEFVVTHISADNVASLIDINDKYVKWCETSRLTKAGKTAVVQISKPLAVGELK